MSYQQQGGYQQKPKRIFCGNAYTGKYGLSGHITLDDIPAEHIHTGSDGKRYVKIYINRNKQPVPNKPDHNITVNTKPPLPANQQAYRQEQAGGYAPQQQSAQGGYQQQAPQPNSVVTHPAHQGGHQPFYPGNNGGQQEAPPPQQDTGIRQYPDDDIPY